MLAECLDSLNRGTCLLTGNPSPFMTKQPVFEQLSNSVDYKAAAVASKSKDASMSRGHNALEAMLADVQIKKQKKGTTFDGLHELDAFQGWLSENDKQILEALGQELVVSVAAVGASSSSSPSTTGKRTLGSGGRDDGVKKRRIVQKAVLACNFPEGRLRLGDEHVRASGVRSCGSIAAPT